MLILDRRKQEQHINSFPNFKSKVTDDDGHVFDIHFAALFSQKKDAIPVVLLHGWPGSFLEFLPTLDILRTKYSPNDLPYHIIIPSLPGYTLSSQSPLTANWKIADTARVLHKLVVQQLGFPSYIVQGGDIGAAVARTMAVTYAECKAVHLNHSYLPQPDNVPDSAHTEQEKKMLERFHTFNEYGNAYGRMHGTRPSTIGHVLSSSPLALLAWIGEKFIEWADPSTVPSLATILTHVTLYWFTECFPTAIYPYREDYKMPRNPGYFHGQKHLYVDKPLGYSYFPYELAPIPKAWVETTGRMVWFKAHGQGGHFAALERPEVFLEDVEGFVGNVAK